MQLLLMAQKQVSPGEAARALWAFEGLLLGVGALMALQMLQTGEGALACAAYVWARLVGLGRGKGRVCGGGGVGFDGLDGSCI